MPNGVLRQNVRVAAVLMPLIAINQHLHVLFTKRTETVMSHKGQISFPGGMAEKADRNPSATALRETEEELGIKQTSIELLGRLDPIQTFTNILIYPLVGFLEWPLTLQLSRDEVSKVILIPLEWLANPSNSSRRNYNGHSDVIFFQPYEGEVLWGITATMTKKLIAMLDV